MSIPDPTIDPITGLPLLNPNTPIQQIPLGADVFPFADLKASAQPARGPIYGDDIIPTSSLLSGQHPTLANAQTVQTDGAHAAKVYVVNQSSGGGPNQHYKSTVVRSGQVTSLDTVNPFYDTPGLSAFYGVSFGLSPATTSGGPYTFPLLIYWSWQLWSLSLGTKFGVCNGLFGVKASGDVDTYNADCFFPTPLILDALFPSAADVELTLTVYNCNTLYWASMMYL